MLKKEVLRRDKDFSALYKKGKSFPDKYIVLIYRKNGLSYNRTAFLASKKVGNSVQRNRAKRLIREGYRLIESELKQGNDIVFIARKNINGRKFGEVNRSLLNAVKRTGLLKSKEE
ncbi:MAG: ribonuclease P protein component [Firmicutes bacterium]|nr:ribonuclease P protein component [Bacillota bacterium]